MPQRQPSPRLLPVLAALFALSACRGIDFGDNPPKAPPKADRSLTTAPVELVNGTAR